ncbi:MAG TPA: hypothetical protein DCW90_11375 [Lachnospiraceae bacterium]|nr:hypothetical protein [Lachnospiraceae bacterium]
MGIQGDIGKLLSGMPIAVPGVNVAVSQPKIKDICAFGEDDFFFATQFFLNAEKLVIPIKEGNPQLSMLDTFQLLLIIIRDDKQAKENIEKFFELIFPNYKVEILSGMIQFKVNDKIVGRLNSFAFENFQKVLRDCFVPTSAKDDEQEYNPANDAAAEIAAKLKRGNEIRAKQKADEQGDIGSLFGNYASVLSIGLSLDINVLYNYTPFQLFDSYKRYQTKLQYDLYQKIATTPMMDVSKMKEPDNWMDNIYRQ